MNRKQRRNVLHCESRPALPNPVQIPAVLEVQIVPKEHALLHVLLPLWT